MKFFLSMQMVAATFVATTALATTLAMPPNFTVQSDPGTVLRNYPLGTITKQAAFSHHGKSVRTLILPNGKEGWVYEVGVKQAETYANPTGRKQTVYETGAGDGVRTYTLVFDDKGVVIDVLYNEQGRHDGLAALQVQSNSWQGR
jgi:hypothetical protein